MNGCRFCELEIGKTYNCTGEHNFPCCSSKDDGSTRRAKYVKYDGAHHYFESLKEQHCPVCGKGYISFALPCMDYSDGLFIGITVEIPVMIESEK
jgi:hypothetical protein